MNMNSNRRTGQFMTYRVEVMHEGTWVLMQDNITLDAAHFSVNNRYTGWSCRITRAKTKLVRNG